MGYIRRMGARSGNGAWLLAGLFVVTACGGGFSTSEESGGDGNGPGDGDGDGFGSGGAASSGEGSGGGRETGGEPGTGGALGSGGTQSTGGISGVGGTPTLSGCPMTPPNPALPCSPGNVCTYGDDPRLGCRESYTCSDARRWTVESPDCEPVPLCGDSGFVSNGDPCDVVGETCWFPDHSPVCQCIECGASAECSSKGEYQCNQENPPCPSLPPNLGQPCGTVTGGVSDVEGEICQYARCGSPYHVQIQCTDATWTQLDVVCPDP